MIVGPLSSPSGSITSGRDRNGSITDGRDAWNLLLARATRHARAAPSLTVPAAVLPGGVSELSARDLLRGTGLRGIGARRRRAWRAVGTADGELAALAVEDDYVPGIDKVRVADLLAVQIPQLGPAPWRIGVALRDAPKGVAGHDGIAVRRIGLDGERRAGRLCRKPAPESKKASAMIDLRTCWTMATRPFFWFLDRLEIGSSSPNVAQRRFFLRVA